MSKATKENLFELLQELKDHRRCQGRRHSIQIVVIIIMMAIMSGAKGERAVTRFAKNNEDELIEILKIARKEIPSRSVIRGVIQNLDFDILQKILYKWYMNFITIEESEWISIDGKSINGTVLNANDKLQNFVSLVTVFMSKKKIILSAGRFESKKQSEIPTARKLIELLDLHGVTFTLDSLHCQVKTVNAIIESGNNYLIGVKGNQKNMLNKLKKTV